MIEEARCISDRGGMFLEAPVSGSKVPAENGQLIFLCGGGLPTNGLSRQGADETVFERVKPALDSMGKASFFFGPVGQGSRVKLIVNMVMGTMMTSFAEGLSLSEAAELPSEKLLEVIDLGAIACPMFKGKGPSMLQKKFDTNFPLKHAQKDMRFALAMADQLGIALPTNSAANSEYIKALDTRGNPEKENFFYSIPNLSQLNPNFMPGDDDFAAVFAVDRKKSFSIGDFFGGLFKQYKGCLQQYPIYTKSLTSCSIAIVGEVIASVVKGLVRQEKINVDLRRVAVFGVYGLVCTGPMLHYWYMFLEFLLTKKLGLSGNSKVLVKLLIDRGIWAPPFVLFTITFLQFLQTFCPKETAAAVKRNYAAVLLMNQKVWVPGQALNFAAVPVEYQVLFVNAVNVGWNTYLSFSQ